MPRKSPRNLRRREALGDFGRAEGERDLMRRHVAYLAARLIAEDGITDYAAAKQKAARQARIEDAWALPDNHEIDAELRAYQSLYQGDKQPRQLAFLRGIAVEAMRLFGDFNPYLVGPVLTGTANEFSDIELQLFADDCKEIEMFLINRRIPYRAGLRHVRLRGRLIDVPQIELERGAVTVCIAVFAAADERIVQKSKADGRPVERARLPEVEALLGGAHNGSTGA
jgi:hypothetical protein